MSLLSIDTAALRDSPVIRVWRHDNYALLMSGLAPYYVTSLMQRVGVGWLAWELSRSYFWVGAIAAADLLPLMVLGPLAGALADRSDPIKMMRWSQIFMIVQAVLLAALTLAGQMDTMLLLVLSVFSGVILPLFTAARQMIVPATVPREDLASALSLDSSLYHASRFVGPMLAAFSIPLIGVGGTFLAHVIGSIVFFATLCRTSLPAPPHRGRKHENLLAEIVEGAAYARNHAGLWPLFLILAVASLLGRPLQEMLPGFAGGVLNAGATGLAWMTSSMGAGSLAAGIVLATRGHARGLTYLSILSTCGLAIAVFGFVATKELPYALTFGALFGFTLTLMGVGIQLLTQDAVADGMRGRVMIFYAMIYRGFPALGALLIGFLAEYVGLRTSFAIAALLCLLAWLVIAPRHQDINAAMTARGR